MTSSFPIACRYPDKNADALVDVLAELNAVERGQILLGDGSGEILKLAADVFTGPVETDHEGTKGGALVAGDPTFEAILHHAKANGAEVVKVPLNASFAHDLDKMLTAAKAGLVYICNPNNPTASITPKKQLRDFIAKAPNDTIVLVDEAYHHYADSPDYESVIPLVTEHPNLMVARTFSKVYGMAGLRCGYCVAQSSTVERLRERQSWGQRQHHGGGGGEGQSRGRRSGPKGTPAELGSAGVHRRRIGPDGFSDNSVPGQLHHVRCQAAGGSFNCHPEESPGRKSAASSRRCRIICA
jgi:hypothetical protein